MRDAFQSAAPVRVAWACWITLQTLSDSSSSKTSSLQRSRIPSGRPLDARVYPLNDGVYCPRTLQDPPRTAQDPPRTAPERSKMPPEPHLGDLKPHLEGHLPHLRPSWLHLRLHTPILGHLGRNLGASCAVLGASWPHLGPRDPQKTLIFIVFLKVFDISPICVLRRPREP